MTAENLRSTYMKVPLVDLKTAIQHVPESEKILRCLKISSNFSQAKFGLTYEEIAAIKSYTTECLVYTCVNIALRSKEHKNIEPWFAFLKLFHNGISKLDAQKRIFCRGERDPWQSTLYAVGDIVNWWAITSLSSSSEVCELFLQKDYKGKLSGVIYWVNSFSAKDVTHLSAIKSERESILLPATKLQVISKKMDARNENLYTIELQEIDSASQRCIPDLESYTINSVDDAYAYCEESYKLTEDELAAVRLYIGSFVFDMANRALRTNELAKS